MESNAGNIKIWGKPVDEYTRCEHYHSPLDVIAIKFKCCDRYYPCFQCHEETAGHAAVRWPKDERAIPAILCGQCKTEISIQQYMNAGHQCPCCGAAFNPGCSRHYHLYFEM